MKYSESYDRSVQYNLQRALFRNAEYGQGSPVDRYSIFRCR